MSREKGDPIDGTTLNLLGLPSRTPFCVKGNNEWNYYRQNDKFVNSTEYHLEKDHPAYTLISVNNALKHCEMFRLTMGPDMPSDYVDRKILLRSGEISASIHEDDRVAFRKWKHLFNSYDVIGYLPYSSKGIDINRPIEAVNRFTNKTVKMNLLLVGRGFFSTESAPDPSNSNDMWHMTGRSYCRNDVWYIRNVRGPEMKLSDDTVLFKKKTVKEIEEEFDEIYYNKSRSEASYKECVINYMKKLGIVKIETPVERFKSAFPEWKDVPDDAITAALEWRDEKP